MRRLDGSPVGSEGRRVTAGVVDIPADIMTAAVEETTLEEADASTMSDLLELEKEVMHLLNENPEHRSPPPPAPRRPSLSWALPGTYLVVTLSSPPFSHAPPVRTS
jgi:hypothetical protein